MTVPSWGDNESTRQTESSSSLLIHVGKRCVLRFEPYQLMRPTRPMVNGINRQLTVRRYQRQVAEARSLLRQGWQMAQLAQDHWRECTCLTNLVMLELEVGQFALALDYCSELIHVSAQIMLLQQPTSTRWNRRQQFSDE